MRARWIYFLLFLPISIMGAMAAGMAAVGAMAGVLWIFIYGDDPWPASAEPIVMGVAVLIFAALLGLFCRLAYMYGKRQEEHGGVKRKHVIVAVALGVALPLLMWLR